MEEDKNLLPPVLGCLPDQPDKRDHIYEEVMGLPPPEMPSFEEGYSTESKILRLRDELQGYTLGCVTFGGTNDIEMSVYAITQKKIQLSQRDAYSQIYIKPGGASSPRDFYKLANQKGICEDDYLPTNAGSELKEEWLRSRQGASQASIENAAKWKIGEYLSIQSLEIQAIAQAVFSNWGCGGAYWPIGSQLGHFIFVNGYGMYQGYKAISYRDSYLPVDKWIYLKNNNWYLSHPAGTQVSLGSFWTIQPGDWGQKNMPKLLRKKNTNEVFLVLNGKRYWIKEEPNFNDLVNSQPITNLSWSNVEEVDTLFVPYDGEIIGKPNLSDVLKNLFGIVK